MKSKINFVLGDFCLCIKANSFNLSFQPGVTHSGPPFASAKFPVHYPYGPDSARGLLNIINIIPMALLDLHDPLCDSQLITKFIPQNVERTNLSSFKTSLPDWNWNFSSTYIVNIVKQK